MGRRSCSGSGFERARRVAQRQVVTSSWRREISMDHAALNCNRLNCNRLAGLAIGLSSFLDARGLHVANAMEPRLLTQPRVQVQECAGDGCTEPWLAVVGDRVLFNATDPEHGW